MATPRQVSRSAIELTRFTATAPHAYSKISALRNVAPPPASKSSSNRQKPASHSLPLYHTPRTHQSSQNDASPTLSLPITDSILPPPSALPRETPTEKVARLRAARFKERIKTIPLEERIIMQGRIWADRIHRSFVVFLLLFSAVAVLIAIYTTADMIIFNRRKRKAWVKDQALAYQKGVTGAIEAEIAGLELNEEQRLILGRERTRLDEEEAAERRKKERWAITKWLFEGLSMGDDDDDENLVNAATSSEKEKKEGEAVGNSNSSPSISTTEAEQQIAQSPILSAVQAQQSQSQPPAEPDEVSPSLEISTTPVPPETTSSNTEPAAPPKRSWWGGK